MDVSFSVNLNKPTAYPAAIYTQNEDVWEILGVENADDAEIDSQRVASALNDPAKEAALRRLGLKWQERFSVSLFQNGRLDIDRFLGVLKSQIGFSFPPEDSYSIIDADLTPKDAFEDLVFKRPPASRALPGDPDHNDLPRFGHENILAWFNRLGNDKPADDDFLPEGIYDQVLTAGEIESVFSLSSPLIPFSSGVLSFREEIVLRYFGRDTAKDNLLWKIQDLLLKKEIIAQEEGLERDLNPFDLLADTDRHHQTFRMLELFNRLEDLLRLANRSKERNQIDPKIWQGLHDAHFDAFCRAQAYLLNDDGVDTSLLPFFSPDTADLPAQEIPWLSVLAAYQTYENQPEEAKTWLDWGFDWATSDLSRRTLPPENFDRAFFNRQGWQPLDQKPYGPLIRNLGLNLSPEAVTDPTARTLATTVPRQMIPEPFWSHWNQPVSSALADPQPYQPNWADRVHGFWIYFKQWEFDNPGLLETNNWRLSRGLILRQLPNEREPTKPAHFQTESEYRLVLKNTVEKKRQNLLNGLKELYTGIESTQRPIRDAKSISWQSPESGVRYEVETSDRRIPVKWTFRWYYDVKDRQGVDQEINWVRAGVINEERKIIHIFYRYPPDVNGEVEVFDQDRKSTGLRVKESEVPQNQEWMEVDLTPQIDTRGRIGPSKIAFQRISNFDRDREESGQVIDRLRGSGSGRALTILQFTYQPNSETMSAGIDYRDWDFHHKR